MTAELQRQMIEAMPYPVFIIGPEDRIVLANAATEDFFQIGFSLLAKAPLHELFPFSTPAFEAISRVRSAGGIVNEYEISIGTPRYGGERVVDFQTVALPELAGHVLAIIQLQSIAQKIDQQLLHHGAARSVSGMAAMLAHEIKNPLAGIRGAAQLLETSVPDEDKAMTQLICDETDRIRELVDQMEVFSDERPLQRAPVNIHVVLGRVKQLIQAMQFKDLKIVEDYDPSLPDVSGNHDQLVQVFLNLAKNAVEAMPQGGELKFATAFRPGFRIARGTGGERVSLPLEVSIHDEGSGVPEDIRQHVFEPFISTKSQGRGLGLALVAKIVRDHGGVVECAPRDKGTTFRVLLPLEKKLP